MHLELSILGIEDKLVNKKGKYLIVLQTKLRGREIHTKTLMHIKCKNKEAKFFVSKESSQVLRHLSYSVKDIECVSHEKKQGKKRNIVDRN
jgi:hypothetical protein